MYFALLFCNVLYIVHLLANKEIETKTETSVKKQNKQKPSCTYIGSIDLILRVLILHAFDLVFKAVYGVVVPPLFQVAVFVVLATRVIKPVGDFMPHDDPHTTKVQ